MTEINRQIVLKSRPSGRVKESDFALRERPIPTPAEGEVLVRNLYVSLDPVQRIWLRPSLRRARPVGIGEVIRSIDAGRVVESRHPRFAKGDSVVGLLGWQDYGVAAGSDLEKVVHELPLSASLGVLGMTGRTAYFGLLEIGRPNAGETVVVSAAAGAVGSIVGQIARLKGCRAVGIAGSDEKCGWITGTLGFDAAINHRAPDFYEALREACPEGVDVYFDNVGGATLDTVLRLINLHARIVICGAISTYNDTEPAPGPANYLALMTNRARMEGFVVYDYEDRFPEATARLASWVKEGKVKYAEDVVEGLEAAPRAFNRLFEGANVGKLILRIANE